jgi:Ca2+/H+ antiporter
MAVGAETDFLVRVMFWTILAIMLVILYMLKVLNQTQRHLESIDLNIEKMVRRTLLDEERILDDLEHRKPSRKRK